MGEELTLKEALIVFCEEIEKKVKEEVDALGSEHGEQIAKVTITAIVYPIISGIRAILLKY